VYVLPRWDSALVAFALLSGGAVALLLLAGFLQRRRHRNRTESAYQKKSRTAEETSEASRMDAAKFAERVAQRVRFVEGLKVSGEVSFSKIVGGKVGRERTLSSLPLSAADLYLEFARLVDRLRESGYDVVIGIDELDKLYIDEDARKFLNDMKILFTIRDCSFIVTISENAWSEFERRGLSIRDVFDSSLDTVVRVEQLSYVESRSFLRRRTNSLSDTAIAFCHCLSGGLARDLLRSARSLGEANDELPAGATLDLVAHSVLLWEMRSKAEAVTLALDSQTNSLRSAALKRELELVAQSHSAVDWIIASDKFLAIDDTFEALVFNRSGDSREKLANRSHAESITSDAGLDEMRQEFYTYLLFLATLHELFCRAYDDVKWFEQDPLSLMDRLAAVRARLESDTVTTWRDINSIRMDLGLGCVGQPGRSAERFWSANSIVAAIRALARKRGTGSAAVAESQGRHAQ
jgi:hypothetical protein